MLVEYSSATNVPARMHTPYPEISSLLLLQDFQGHKHNFESGSQVTNPGAGRFEFGAQLMVTMRRRTIGGCNFVVGMVSNVARKFLAWCGLVKNQGLQRKGSSTSSKSTFSDAFSSGLLPALGANVSSRNIVLRKYVIHPYNRRYRSLVLSTATFHTEMT